MYLAEAAKTREKARRASTVYEDMVRGLSVELESHQKALKGLTSKYNQLEQQKNYYEAKLAQRASKSKKSRKES